MILQPVIPLPVLIPLALIVLMLAGWLCAAACKSLCAWLRVGCVVLALLASAAGLALLLNPGRVEQRPSPHAPLWLVGLDVSASMAAPVRDSAEAETRSSVAAGIIERLAEAGKGELRWLALDETLHPVSSPRELVSIPAAGKGSAIMASLAAGIETCHRSGRTVAGAVLVTDGRDTRPQALQQLVAAAGAAACPVHTLLLGSTWQHPDLIVQAAHPFVQAYPGVETTLTARIHNVRMEERQVQVELVDSTGSILQQKVITLSPGVEQEVDFRHILRGGEYVLRVAPQPGEYRQDNNRALVTVREVNSRIRVFLAEGAPFWDSKFLAQYLREQSIFDVRSVHRLSDKRYYHINSGDEDAAPSDTPDIPTTAAALRHYDIVVLGKGMEHLLDHSAVMALSSWVKEQGGILVLARGRCLAGRMEGLEELEPFIWQEDSAPVTGRMLPAPSGVDGGLFGRLLPGAEDEIWQQLPELEDVLAVKDLRDRTRVLATADDQSRTPILAVMSCGLGAVACVNGEGLWKWDFYPEARVQGNMYREFWRRFLPWVQTSAEFMPGFDLSLHAGRSSVKEGEGFHCLMGWRGIGRPESVVVQVINLQNGQVVAEQKAVPVATASLPRWECVFAPVAPGEYLLRAVAAETPSPECRLSVRPLPTEGEDLNAHPELAAGIAEQTGGRVLSTSLTAEELAVVFAMPPDVSATEDVYCPLWAEWQVLAFMVACLGLLWFIRRRKGLL